MSQKSVHQIIGKAVLDKQYLAKLMKTPTSILSKYPDLTAKERKMLTTLSIAQVGKMQGKLSRRVTKGQVSAW